MRGLLMKDFRLMLQRKRFFLIMLFVACCMSLGAEPQSAIAYLVMIFSLFSVSTMSYDEYDNCYTFLLTLPIDRKTYVREKYLLCTLFATLSWILGAVICRVSCLVNPGAVDIVQQIIISLIYVPLGIFMVSITIPFQLKYGMERGRMAIMVTFGAVIALVILFSKTIGQNVSKIWLDLDLTGMFQGIDTKVLVLPAIVILAVLVLCSVKISESIMNHKDL